MGYEPGEDARGSLIWVGFALVVTSAAAMAAGACFAYRLLFG